MPRKLAYGEWYSKMVRQVQAAGITTTPLPDITRQQWESNMTPQEGAEEFINTHRRPWGIDNSPNVDDDEDEDDGNEW